MKKTSSWLIGLLIISTGVSAQNRVHVTMKDGTMNNIFVSDIESVTWEEMDYSGANGHEYIDLGLSVMWATCNLGATVPEEYGDYFAWGETEPYYNNEEWNPDTSPGYCWESYKWCEGSFLTYYRLTKYCTNERIGEVDSLTVLQSEDDAASVNWGGAWRLPSHIEMDELCHKCIWEQVERNGIEGFVITGPNGNNIFMPMAGELRYTSRGYSGHSGAYWTSSIHLSNSAIACSLDFNINGDKGAVCASYNRCLGLTIRPVFECP